MEIVKFVTGPIGVNTYIVPIDDKSVFITDPGGDEEKIKQWIDSHNVVVKAILLTHGHFDHVLALAPIKAMFPEAFIMIHAADAHYLGAGGMSYHIEDIHNCNCDAYISYIENLPDVDVPLNEGDEPINDWVVIHTPGHTPGSICLYNKIRGEMLSGDTLFDGGYGRTDLAGGSAFDLMESLNKLNEYPKETRVYPGHGPETTIASMAAFC